MTYIEIYFLHTVQIVLLLLCVTGLEINYYLLLLLLCRLKGFSASFNPAQAIL